MPEAPESEAESEDEESQDDQKSASELSAQVSEEYYRATFVYFVFCMIVIIFFSMSYPKKLKRWCKNKCPWAACICDMECLETDEEREERIREEQRQAA